MISLAQLPGLELAAPQNKRPASRAGRFEAYLRACFERESPPRVSELARVIRMPLPRFAETFHASTGITPSHYLKERQIEAAKLLRGPISLWTKSVTRRDSARGEHSLERSRTLLVWLPRPSDERRNVSRRSRREVIHSVMGDRNMNSSKADVRVVGGGLFLLLIAMATTAQTAQIAALKIPRPGLPPFLPITSSSPSDLGFRQVADYVSRTLFEGPSSAAGVLLDRLAKEGYAAALATDLETIFYHGYRIETASGRVTPPAGPSPLATGTQPQR